MKVWTPRPYQPLMIDFMLKKDRCALFVDMGLGKTSSVLAVIEARHFAGIVNKVLVIAPKRVSTTTWPEEVKKWEQFSSLRVSVITGDPKQRLAALRADADIYTINYDVVEWLVTQCGNRWPFDMVVADESTRLKSYRTRQGGVRAKALAKIAARTRYWVNLTGTPAPNGLQDLWGQTWFLDAGSRLGRTYTAFEDRFFGFKRKQDAFGAKEGYVERVVFPHSQAEIEGLLRDVCLTLQAKDWFNLAEPIVNNIYIELKGETKKKYREMERELFTSIDGNEIEAFSAAAKTLKCLQIANGAAYVDGSNEEWVEVHDDKLDALQSVIEEAAGRPVLVAYHFRSDLARILRRFPTARRLDADPNTISQWNKGEIPILLAHPASAGHGLNLQDGGNILVFFGHWWNLEERQQIIERIGPVRQKQAGHDRPVYIHNIIAKDTVDELVIARIGTKKSVQDLLLEAMKHRKDER